MKDEAFMTLSSYYQESRHEMLRYLPSSARTVLDVGCGAGAFGRCILARQKCYIVGVEENSAASVEAERFLHKIYNCKFDECVDFQGLKFDAIFFNDVLEHMINPCAALMFAKSIIANNGVVVTSIPNMRHFSVLKELFLKRNFEYRDAGILDKTHLRFFTSMSMRRLFADAGFEIVKHEGINEVSDRSARLLANFFPKLFNDIVYLQFATVAICK